MRIWLYLVLLSLPLLAQSGPSIANITWAAPDTSGGQRIKAHITLTGPAPEGGTKVIFEPTFHLELPTQVMVPAGQTGVDFFVPVVDNRFFSNYGFRSITDVNGSFSNQTSVTALCNGQTWEGPGPSVQR